MQQQKRWYIGLRLELCQHFRSGRQPILFRVDSRELYQGGMPSSEKCCDHRQSCAESSLGRQCFWWAGQTATPRNRRTSWSRWAFMSPFGLPSVSTSPHHFRLRQLALSCSAFVGRRSTCGTVCAVSLVRCQDHGVAWGCGDGYTIDCRFRFREVVGDAAAAAAASCIAPKKGSSPLPRAPDELSR
eukprot:SAG31_NODE_773_length_12173_cov_15.778173_11_plen_186_part_00